MLSMSTMFKALVSRIKYRTPRDINSQLYLRNIRNISISNGK